MNLKSKTWNKELLQHFLSQISSIPGSSEEIFNSKRQSRYKLNVQSKYFLCLFFLHGVNNYSNVLDRMTEWWGLEGTSVSHLVHSTFIFVDKKLITSANLCMPSSHKKTSFELKIQCYYWSKKETNY